MRMIISKKPNYEKAQQEAYQTIIQSNLLTLPINLKKIIDTFDNLHLKKYSSFARESGLTIEETSELLNSDEGCLWRRDDNKYIIFYNDTVAKKERIRFTIAHEIGHFVLKHHEIDNKTNISRYSLTHEESEILEKEANYFAKRLLAPLPLIYSFVDKWNTISREHIMSIFDVSFLVSGYLIKDLRRIQSNGIIRIHHEELENQFNYFIYQETNKHYCSNCTSIMIGINLVYCIICGSKSVTKINNENYVAFIGFKGDDTRMLYPSHELDDEMRVTVCPKCENENVEGNYCIICSTFLFNICTGFNPNEDNSYYYQDGIQWHNFQHGCGIKLEGNARFCHQCGSTSSFFEDGLLKRWDEEREEQRQLVSITGDKLPF